MPCAGCISWVRPETGPKNIGTCELDASPAHSNYHCKRYRPKGSPRHLGLTWEEIDWLHAHASYPAARELITLYRMVCAAPNDPGARALFAVTLDKWRARKVGPVA
jgi:hypothetical protein